jgi:hypothetical protein
LCAIGLISPATLVLQLGFDRLPGPSLCIQLRRCPIGALALQLGPGRGDIGAGIGSASVCIRCLGPCRGSVGTPFRLAGSLMLDGEQGTETAG